MDPYRVLGVTPDASDEEIKRAYRKLIRRYHPDSNINNPDKEKAARMFENVQKAYDSIMNMRKGDRSYSYSNETNNYGESDTDNFLRAAANYINAGYYQEALNALNNVSPLTRGGEWYYLASAASAGIGERDIAISYIQHALSYDPNNIRYIQLKNRLVNGSPFGGYYGNSDASGWYDYNSGQYKRSSGMSAMPVCLELLSDALCCCFFF